MCLVECLEDYGIVVCITETFSYCKGKAVLHGFIHVSFLVSDMLCNHLCHTGKPLALEAINPEKTTVGGVIPRFMTSVQPDWIKDEQEVKGDFNS